MKALLVRVVMIAGFAVATLSVAQNTLRPGQYEVTMEMRMPGASAPIRMTQMDCVSPEEAASFFELMRQENDLEDCTISELVTSGNKVSWETHCDNLSAKSELTFTADGFTGVVQTIADGEAFPTTMSARWVGAICTTDDE